MLPLEWHAEARVHGGFVMVVEETVYPWRKARRAHSQLVVDAMTPESLWLLCLHDAERIMAGYNEGRGVLR